MEGEDIQRIKYSRLFLREILRTVKCEHNTGVMLSKSAKSGSGYVGPMYGSIMQYQVIVGVFAGSNSIM